MFAACPPSFLAGASGEAATKIQAVSPTYLETQLGLQFSWRGRLLDEFVYTQIRAEVDPSFGRTNAQKRRAIRDHCI